MNQRKPFVIEKISSFIFYESQISHFSEMFDMMENTVIVKSSRWINKLKPNLDPGLLTASLMLKYF